MLFPNKHHILQCWSVLALSFAYPVIVFSCSKKDIPLYEYRLDIIDTVSVVYYTYNHWEPDGKIIISQYAPLGFLHQSAAAYGDYAFFVNGGRSEICLYNLSKKEMLCSLSLKGVDGNKYHCNQSSFGIDKYDPSDAFPLLYISQRAGSDKRCFIEVFRIIPVLDENTSDYCSFSIDLIQTIYLPPMTYENSLGNANCVIDSANSAMYTYSRNNNSEEDNYGQCRITQFTIPALSDSTIYLEDKDILSSFSIDCQAINMQGGCINEGVLYIGQGLPAVGYMYLNIIDLEKKSLIRRINLQDYGIGWEPEGCFFYDASVMLSHTSFISRIDK